MTETQTVQPGKPWYRKWRYIIPLALLVIVIIAVASSSGGQRGIGEGSDAARGSDDASPTTDPSERPASEAAAPDETPANEEEPAEGDQGVVFGEPVIFNESGFTTMAAMVENVSDTVRTFTVKATFLSGGSIVATGVGAVNDLAPGQRRASSLLVDESPLPAYDEVLLQVDTMLDQGSDSESAEIAEQLTFGEPRINDQSGFVSVDVQVTNGSSETVTFTVGAAFLNGDALVGTGTGAVNDLAPGETQTATLLTSGDTNASEVLLYADTLIVAND